MKRTPRGESMSEQDKDTEIRTHSEDADNYIKELQEKMEGESDAKKVEILLEKTRYWYCSAIDWRGFYEAELQRGKGT